MHLVYRGVRYELASSTPNVGFSALEESPISYNSDLTSPSSGLHLNYRGLSYPSPFGVQVSCDSDPELESFIEAFWSIINA